MMSGPLRMAGHGYRRHQAHFPHECFLQQPLPIAPCVSQEGNSQRIYLPMMSGVLRTAQPGQPQRLPRHGGVGSLLSLCRLTGACGFWEDSGAARMQISRSSADGVSWKQETAQAEFGPRFSHRVITDGKKAVADRGKRWVSECPARCLVQLRRTPMDSGHEHCPILDLASRKVPSI